MNKQLLKSLIVISFLAFSSIRSQGAVQIIHNCADPIAQTVDVYYGSTLLLDDFAFRAATPFVPVPAGTAVIGIALSNSTSVADTISGLGATLTLAPGVDYIVVASGVTDPNNFAANPDGRAINFTLNVSSNARSTSSSGSTVDLRIHHGSTDAPSVDVVPMGTPTPLVDNAAYGDFTSYLSVPAAAYKLNITPANDNSLVVASYNVDISSLGGAAAFVFASGFLDPSLNQGGAAFGLFAALPNGTVVQFPTNDSARVQILHNAADPNAASVDVYLDNALILDNFAFRTATPFLTLASNTNYNIGIAPSNSSSVADVLVTIPVTLQSGQTYMAVASGVLNPPSFGPNPNGLNTGFQLLLHPGVFESSSSSSTVRLFALHGATDVPAIDVFAQGNPTALISNITYTSFSSSFELPNSLYYLDVSPAGTPIVVATYLADLTGLGGGAGMIFASGFLNPSQNQNGAQLGLFAVLSNGSVVPLPSTTFARVQVIHNAADPAAAVVDVYAGSSLLIDDFAFRSATPFVNVPAGVDVPIGIALSNSASAADTIPGLGTTLNLTAGTAYAVVANGVLNTSIFASNPDGRPTGFTYFVKSGALVTGSSSTDVDVAVLHGATDAPTVDVVSGSTLVNDAAYGDFTGYLTLPNASYVLDITLAPGTPVVAQYTADLTALGGGAAIVFASGFLDPSQNQNGPAFGLYAALPSGVVVALPPYVNTNARVQIIHNSADPAASTVDVYAGSTLLIDDFDFREATPFVDVPGGVDIPVGIAPANSASAGDTIPGLGTTINLTIGNKYVIIANGVTSPGSFASNPDGRTTGFTYFVLNGAMEMGSDPSSVDFAVLHGATDAPTVDVITSGLTLVDNAAYGDITSYINVPAADYILDITPAAGSPVLVSYDADLSTLGGGAAVVFASGFLDPSQNQNGPAFGLFAALTDGTVIPFPVFTGVEELDGARLATVFPNPASNQFRISFNKEVKGVATISMFNITGQNVVTQQVETANGPVAIDVATLPAGLYNLTVLTQDGYFSRQVVINR